MNDEACKAAVDVAVIRAIGAVIVAAIQRGLWWPDVIDAGEAAGEAIGKGFMACVRVGEDAAKTAEEGEAEPADEPAVDKALIVHLLNDMRLAGSKTWTISDDGEDVACDEGYRMTIDTAKWIVGRNAYASAEGGPTNMSVLVHLLNEKRYRGVDDWRIDWSNASPDAVHSVALGVRVATGKAKEAVGYEAFMSTKGGI